MKITIDIGKILIIIITIVGFYISAIYFYWTIYRGFEPSLIFFFCMIGVGVFWLLIAKKEKIIGKIEEMSLEELRFYYEQIFQTYRSIFIGFSFLIGIIWGLSYREGFTFLKLKFQTVLLLLFWVYIVVSSYWMIVIDLKRKFHEKSREKNRVLQRKI